MSTPNIRLSFGHWTTAVQWQNALFVLQQLYDWCGFQYNLSLKPQTGKRDVIAISYLLTQVFHPKRPLINPSYSFHYHPPLQIKAFDLQTPAQITLEGAAPLLQKLQAIHDQLCTLAQDHSSPETLRQEIPTWERNRVFSQQLKDLGYGDAPIEGALAYEESLLQIYLLLLK